MLKIWNKEVFGNVQESIKDVESQINSLDLIAETCPLSSEDISRKKKLKEEFWKLSRRLEWIWLQKSRLDWSLKGDKNTSFFHLTANGRQSMNLLNALVIDGSSVDDPGKIKSEIFTFFQETFKEEWQARPKLDGPFQAILNREQGDLLTKPFEEEEIWQAIASCDGNKAPGPDGFNISFIKSS